MPATVFEVDVKTRSTAEPGIRQALFTIFSPMALIAYMPTPAAALPGEVGQAVEPPSSLASASLPAKIDEIDPGPAP